MIFRACCWIRGSGVLTILGARAAGARQIIGADINPDKRQKALELGADAEIDAADPHALEKLKAITGGGVDIAVEFAGAIPALEFALESTKRGGATITAALPHPDARLSISPVNLVGMEKTLKGSCLGTCVPSRDIPNYLEALPEGLKTLDNKKTAWKTFPVGFNVLIRIFL